MAALLAVIIAIGTALLATTAYLEWIGVTSLFTTTRTNPSYDSCGHLKLNLSSHHHQCWRCRPTALPTADALFTTNIFQPKALRGLRR